MYGKATPDETNRLFKFALEYGDETSYVSDTLIDAAKQAVIDNAEDLAYECRTMKYS